MSDSNLTANGLQIATLTQILDELETAFRGIYGQDILLDSNTPDGQLLNIFAQMHLNTLETLQAVYNQFDVSSAVGVQLDQRAALCGISRLGATFTLVNVSLTASQSTTLLGLDGNYWDPSAQAYGVQDINGNIYFLVNSTTIEAGQSTLLFRAQKLGPVLTPSGVISEQYTVNRYITAVNNPDPALETGASEESDVHLRERVRASYALRGTSSVDSLFARISAIDGVSSCRVLENVSDSIDSNGIPAHGIWTIVKYIPTPALNQQIASAIYSEIGFGVQQKLGNQSFTLTTLQGMSAVMHWDEAIPEPLTITLDLYAYTSGTEIDNSALQEYISSNLTYNVGASADMSQVVQVATLGLQAQGASSVAFVQSASVNGAATANPVNEQNYFTVSASNITINYTN